MGKQKLSEKKEVEKSELEKQREAKLERMAARRKAFERKQFKKKLKWLYLSLAILIADQLSKWYVMEYILRPVSRTPFRESLSFSDWYFNNYPVILPYTEVKILPFFNFVMVWNSGVSFGLLGNWGAYGYIFLIIVALIIVALFCVWLYDSKKPYYSCAYAIIIGGAMGNIFDRARFQAVIDFLDFHYGGVHFWAFNVADMAVVIGIGMVLIGGTIFNRMRRQRYKKAAKERRKRVYRYGNYGR